MRKAMRTAGDVELASTQGTHLAARGSIGGPGRFPQVLDVMASGKVNGNTVEIEREMTDLTENQIKYYAVAQAMSSKLGVLRDIVTRAV
jgi:flagellar basal-body rod protein FlgB